MYIIHITLQVELNDALDKSKQNLVSEMVLEDLLEANGITVSALVILT